MADWDPWPIPKRFRSRWPNWMRRRRARRGCVPSGCSPAAPPGGGHPWPRPAPGRRSRRLYRPGAPCPPGRGGGRRNRLAGTAAPMGERPRRRGRRAGHAASRGAERAAPGLGRPDARRAPGDGRPQCDARQFLRRRRLSGAGGGDRPGSGADWRPAPISSISAGESTRPGAQPVSPAEEIRRIEPVVRGLAQRPARSSRSIRATRRSWRWVWPPARASSTM